MLDPTCFRVWGFGSGYKDQILPGFLMAGYHRLAAGWRRTVPCLSFGFSRIPDSGRWAMLSCKKWRVGLAENLHQQVGVCSSAATGAPVASDSSYGGKEVVQVTEAVYNYILAHTREPEILRELREETSSLIGGHMQVSPEQAQLLAMLVQIMGAQRCIEIGVFNGYSSLAVALALPDSGRLVACERCDINLSIAQKYYQRAGVAHKVIVRCGLALDTLQKLLEDGEAESYDFTFIDADKRNYSQYYELLLRLVRPGGIIVVDNVLWHGKVADSEVNDFKTRCIQEFNNRLLLDERVSISMARWKDPGYFSST